MTNSSNKFKIILDNMTQEQVLNFIWIYDQYIFTINEQRDREEDWNIVPLNIEDFYKNVYKKEFK